VPERTVRVVLVADTAQFVAGMRGASGELGLLTAATGRAGRGSRALATTAAAARPGLAGLGAGARGAAAATRDAEGAAVAAGRGMRTAGASAGTAGAAMTRAGAAGASGMGRISAGTAGALRQVRSLGTLLAGGALVIGLAEVVHRGNEYTDSMNKFLEVTRASGAQMASAGREAQALGADMRLPSASASEAADAMVELAKAGLSAGDAIVAARGTIQLAAAARTDVGTAAKIEGDALDQFGLKARDATVVADTLANVANNTSGELTDLAYALKYVGPTAHSLGIGIQEAATAIGLLGKSGIIGETAGTALRSALVNMSKQTPQMKKGLRELGIQAYDAQGNFKGLRYVIGTLHDAQERLTKQQFVSAAGMAFGKPALSAMTALAHQGTENFDQMAVAVGRTGGAAALAAAESKGLGGAMRGLGKQLNSLFLQVYLGIAPSLEGITRRMSGAVSDAIPYVKRGIKTAGDLWDIYGPTVEAKLRGGAAGVRRAAGQMVAPIKQGLTNAAVTVLPLAVTGMSELQHVLHNAASAVGPLADGLHDVLAAVASAGGNLGAFSVALQGGIHLVGALSGVLGPLAGGVGALAHAFAALPGPIQMAVFGMLTLRAFRPQLLGMQQAVVGFGRSGVGAFQSVAVAMRTQQALGARAGFTLSRWGSALAAVEARSPAIAAMSASFRSTSASIVAAGGRMVAFRAAAGGAAAAAGSGLMSGLRGATAFLGGPFGVAMLGATIGLSLLARHQQQAAAAAAEHRQDVETLTQALIQSNGAIDANVRAATAKMLQDRGVAQAADAAGISLRTLTDATLGQGTSLDKLQASTRHAADLARDWITTGDGTVAVETKKSKALDHAADVIGKQKGKLQESLAAQKQYADAVNKGASATQNATNPTTRLKAAIATLGDATQDADSKARALHEALDLLSGGELDVQAAVANMNQAISDLNATWDQGVDHAKGYGKALLQVDGSLDTTKENGRTLFNQMQGLNEQTASAAQATFDYAMANRKGVGPALREAEKRMQGARDAAIETGRKFGLSADEARKLANQMGFIPSALAITMDLKGVPQTTRDLLYVQGLKGMLGRGETIKVAALTKDATRQLEKIGYKIHTLPGGRQITITAPTKAAQAALDALVAKKLPTKEQKVAADTRKAVGDLEAVKAKAASLPPGKQIEVSAPSAKAIAALEDVGLTVKRVPGTKKVTISVPPGVPRSQVASIQAAIDNLHGKKITNTVRTLYFDSVAKKAHGPYAAQYRADGGMIHAANGAVVPGYAPRRDVVPAMLSPGEGILVPEAVRALGGPKAIAMLNRWGRYGTVAAFADGGTVAGTQRYADGGITYTPTVAPALGGISNPKERVDKLVAELRDAWSEYNDAVKALAKVRKDKHHTKAELKAAQKKVSSARGDIADLNQALGQSRYARAPKSFSLHNYQVQLNKSVAATDAWRKNLQKIGHRGGAEVQAMLESMGEEGYSLVKALAKASDKQFKDITSKLMKTADVAKASLADFTKQVGASNKVNAQFAADLEKLAGAGYGDLAQALAAQGDSAAQALAHQAAGGKPADIAKANAAVKTANSTLSGNDLANALLLLTTLRGGTGRGYADLISAGLDTATIKALVPKILGQINKLPDANKQVFLRQWASQAGMTAMARGGITSGPTLAGEAGVPEAYIPLNGTRRSLGLLSSVAGQFGYHLTPVRSGGPGGGGQTVINKYYTVNLQGAKQSSAEQAMDVARHMAFVG
jgi:TP901 family phage tail tape measure protein